MLTFRQAGACEADPALRVLPEGFHAVATAVGSLVVGPTGAFLVVDGDAADVRGDAGTLAAQAATDLRRALADRLTWVPFIEPLVVSSRPGARGAVPIVPRDLLVPIILEGHETVDEPTVRRLVELLTTPDD